MMKKILSFTVILALLASLWIIPAQASGTEEPAPDDLFLPGESSESGDMTITGTEDETSSASFFGFMLMQDGSTDSSLPASFDPRESYSLPEVREQGSLNTCWAMAATATAEFSLLGSDLSAVDLSERHLIYFLSHASDDPLGNSTGDYNTDISFWINRGGNPIVAMMTLSSWHGIASEAATGTPYSGLSVNDCISEEYAYSDVLHLHNTMALNISSDAGRSTLKQMILDYGSAVMCMYYDSDYLSAGILSEEDETASEEPDDPAADGESSAEPAEETSDSDTEEDNTAGTEEAETDSSSESEDTAADPAPEETAETPEPADIPADDTAADETAASSADETESTDAVSADDSISMDGIAEYSESTDGTADDASEEDADSEEYVVCYYQNAYTTTNHEVLVVGWDDNYPAENFSLSSSGAVPPADGAWLCRNSFGCYFAGGDGYFWVSYYDTTVSYNSKGALNTARSVVFDYDSADDYDNNYEYDGSVVMGYVNDALYTGGPGFSTNNATSATRRSYANIFTASASNKRGCELLRAVSTYSYYPGVPYTMSVYVGLTDSTDPTSGTLAATQSGTFTYAGMHTLTLSSPVTLTPGQTFSVVFTVAAADNNSVYIPASYTLQSWRSVNASTAGQSFVAMNDGVWYDCYDLSKQANVRAKAYTDTVNYSFPFTDVTSGNWYYNDIYNAWFECLVEGTSASLYSPNAAATRAAAITVLYRMSGSPDVASTTSFDDVSSDSWYYNAVCWGQENGLILGSDDDGDGKVSFRPNSALTRQELITILFRYAQMVGIDTSSRDSLRTFTDANCIAYWALPAEQWSVGIGIQTGSANDDGTVSLLPTNGVTRAMLAAYLIRLYNLQFTT